MSADPELLNCLHEFLLSSNLPITASSLRQEARLMHPTWEGAPLSDIFRETMERNLAAIRTKVVLIKEVRIQKIVKVHDREGGAAKGSKGKKGKKGKRSSKSAGKDSVGEMPMSPMTLDTNPLSPDASFSRAGSAVNLLSRQPSMASVAMSQSFAEKGERRRSSADTQDLNQSQTLMHGSQMSDELPLEKHQKRESTGSEEGSALEGAAQRAPQTFMDNLGDLSLDGATDGPTVGGKKSKDKKKKKAKKEVIEEDTVEEQVEEIQYRPKIEPPNPREVMSVATAERALPEGTYIYAMTTFDEQIITAGGSGEIQIWSSEELEPIGELIGHAGAVNALTVTTTGYLYSGGLDTTIRVWDIDTRQLVELIREHVAAVYCLKAHEGVVFSGAGDNTIKEFDVDTRKCKRTLLGHTRPVLCADGMQNMLFTGSADSHVRVWDIESGTCIATLTNHTADVNAVLVHEDRLFTGSSDTTVKVWDCWTRECLATISAHVLGVLALVRIGPVLYSAGVENDIKCWDLSTGIVPLDWERDDVVVEEVATHDPAAATRMAMETQQGTLLPLETLVGHTSCVYSLCSVPTSVPDALTGLPIPVDRLYSAGIDKRIKMWKRRPPTPPPPPKVKKAKKDVRGGRRRRAPENV